MSFTSILTAALLGLTINCSDITPAPDPQRGSSEIDRVSNGVYVTTQHVLNLAASMYLQTIDPSKPEDLNGFVRYLREVRNLLIVDAKPGSLIITVKCRSREILEHLWNDYCSGLVNEMAQKYLLSKEVLNELNLTEAKLATTIPEEEYRACQEQLLLYSGEFKGLVVTSMSFSESSDVANGKVRYDAWAVKKYFI